MIITHFLTTERPETHHGTTTSDAGGILVLVGLLILRFGL